MLTHQIPAHIAVLVITMVGAFLSLMLLQVIGNTEDALAAQEAVVLVQAPSDIAR
jgi:hypothetical protein